MRFAGLESSIFQISARTISPKANTYSGINHLTPPSEELKATPAGVLCRSSLNVSNLA